MKSRRSVSSCGPLLRSFSLFLAPVLVCAAPLPLLAQAGQTATPSVQPGSARQVLRGHVPAVVSQLSPVSRLSGSKQLKLAIGLPLRNREGLAALMQQISDPSSPRYRHYLTPEQFGAMFGPTEQDYQAVQDFAKAHRLTVTGTYPSRVLVDVTGSVSDIEQALHVGLHTYHHPTENRDFYAPDVEPSLDLAAPVLHISGLNNFSLPHPSSLHRMQTQPKAGPGSGPGGTYFGTDFRTAYVPGTSLTGAGQIVGLLEFDGYFSSDIAKYVQKANLAPVQLENVYVDGYSGAAGPGNVEVALDIEMVIAMAPQASKIIVYEASNDISLWVDLLSRMATDSNVKQFSCSWGGGGPNPSADQIFQQMAVQGQSFFDAVGDGDAFTGEIPFPSDNPFITQVGGTTLTTGANGAYASETVWNSGGGSGSSGGISTFYPIPSWQQGVDMTANQGSTTLRNTPDVALTADNIYIIADNGVGQPVGGTSAAAPLWAAFTALVNQQGAGGCGTSVGFLNPAIYGVGKGADYTNLMHDIVTGNNFSPGSPALFSATKGYDLCTGWGTPTTSLIDTLAGTATGLLSVSVDPLPGSALLSADSQPVFVTVAGVTNATVVAYIAGMSNLTFANDGQPPDVKSNDFVYSATLPVPASGTVPVMLVVNAAGRPSATNSFSYSVVPAPINDNFANAIKIPAPGATYVSNNRYATLELGEPQHDGDANAAASLWWSWTPSSSGSVLVDTTGSRVDNVLAVYTGGLLSSLFPVGSASSDVAHLRPSRVSFNAQAGQTYRIALASATTNSLGSLQLALTPNGQPDTVLPVVTVTGPQSGLTVSNQLIMVSGTASDSGPNASGVNKVVITVNGCASSPASGTTSWTAPALLRPELNVIEATAYDEAGNVSAPVTIELVYFVVNPDNDFFAHAKPLTGTSGTNVMDTSNATKETGEPNHAGNAGGKSVWFSYTPSVDGVLTVSTAGSTFDTLLGMYIGNVVSALTTIAANDDAYPNAPGGFSLINQAVHSNLTYYIAVDGYDGAFGTNVLSYSFVPAQLVHVTAANLGAGNVQIATVNSLGGRSIQPSTSIDVALNTTVIFTATPAQEYRFDSWGGSVTSFTSPLTLNVTGNLSVTARFLPVVFSDDFESGTLQHLSWSTSGDAPWLIESTNVAAGRYAARSGIIGNSQASSLLLTTNFAASTGSFEYRVSSELNYDFLKFFVDGTLIQQWSGQAGWATFSFPVPSGNHTLQWSYVKDPSGSSGLDAAFIDNVSLPIVLPKDSTTPAHLSWVQGSDGSLTISLTGQVNQQYVLQTSTDLIHWQNLSSAVAANGVVRISPGPMSSPALFYRAVVP